MTGVWACAAWSRDDRGVDVCGLVSRLCFREEPTGRADYFTLYRRFRWKVVSTEMDRDLLYDRINQRVTDMIQKGLKNEVASLLEEGVPEDARSMNGLGYKEMIPCIRGEYSVEDAAEMIRKGTRHYAKRQMTFLRREECIHYVRTDREDAYDEIRRYLL